MRRIFASDLHLQAERPDITEAFCYFLREIAPSAQELYLLGDIFEVWIGDDFPDPVLDRICPLLSALSASGTTIYLQHGNRDFLLGKRGADTLSAKLLPTEHLISLPEGKVLLMHGDELCTDDIAYQQLRRQLRDPNWQKEFLSKPFEERIEIAKQMREGSKQANSMKTEVIMDVSSAAVASAMNAQQVELLIHGHTHRPKIHLNQIAEGIGKRIVLGDWQADGWYLLSDGQRFELINFYPA